MQLLVRTPAPFHDESLFGFVLRASESNGYDDPRHILHVADVGRGQMQTPGFPIEKLAQVLGRRTEELVPIAYQAIAGGQARFKILDHDLGLALRGALRLHEPAICVRCVEESGYIAAFWDLNLAGICPKHGNEVLRKCSACGTPLHWFRPGLLTCNCGATLSGEGCLTANLPAIELMKVVEARLYRTPSISLANPARFPLDALSKMPFSSLLRVLNVLGVQHLWATHASTSEDHSIVASAAGCLEDWPHGYHRFLRALGERSLTGRPSAVGFRKQFSPFYEMMFRSRGIAGHANFLREEFVSFGLKHWGSAAVDKKLLRGGKIGEQRFISKAEFASRFGIWKPTMSRMLADGSAVTKTIGTGKSTRTVIDLQLSQTPVASAGIVDVRDVATYVGLPVSVLFELRAMGVFATKQRLGREASWHKDDVEEFLRAGLALASNRANGPAVIRLKDVMRRKLRASTAKADIVAALFDGRLAAIGRVGDNLGGLLVDRAQLDAFVLKKRVEVEFGSYSFPEAAISTGLDDNTIGCAIVLGLLAAIDRDGRTRVSAASIEGFNAVYVPVSKLAKRLGTLSRVLVRICTENEIPFIALSRANHSALQAVLTRKSEARLLAVWESNTAPRVRRGGRQQHEGV